MFDDVKRNLVHGGLVNKEKLQDVGRCQKIPQGKTRFAFIPQGVYGGYYYPCPTLDQVKHIERFARQHGCQVALRFYMGTEDALEGAKRKAK